MNDWARSGDLPVLGYYHRQAVSRMASIVDGLSLDVNAQQARLTPEFKVAWARWFTNVWSPFYREKGQLGWIEALSPPMMMLLTNDLLLMHQQVLNWRMTFERLGGRSTMPLPALPSLEEMLPIPSVTAPPSRSGRPPMGAFERVMWGAIIVGGIVAVGYVVKAFKSP